MMAPTAGMLVNDAPGAPFVLAPRKSVSVSTKGLLNMPGQNNCFLNSAVQVLWHLDSFRRSFRELSGHACMAESCIFCALKDIFTQFQYSQESALPPDVLRHALAKTFCDQRRFQLGFMDDAAECFENILLRIHVHIANQETEDTCSNANCIPHQKFAMTLVEQRMCHNCGAKSDPMPFTQMVHYVTTSALCAKAMEARNADTSFRSAVPFGTILRFAGEMGELRECPSNCGSKVQVKKTLMNRPEVVSIGLVWDSESPTLQHITDVFHSIGMFLQLQDMFHFVCDSEWAENTTHQMVGIVTYYGKHYSTFFFHTKLKIWIYFDDAAVREVGPSWEQVVEKCQRGRFQPLLLLFANPESSLDNDHPMCFANRASEPLKPVPFNNQRQAVISQYLKFQNSFSNGSPKTDYHHFRNSPHNLPPHPHNGYYRQSDTGLPIYQNTSHWNLGPYSKQDVKNTSQHPTYSNQEIKSIGQLPPYGNQEIKNIGQLPTYGNQEIKNIGQLPTYGNQEIKNTSQLPTYTNLHYLNSVQHRDHQADGSRLSEVSLGKPLPTIRPYDGEALASKTDLDASKDSDSAYAEDESEGNDLYISRKAVESVLSQQKRHMSLCRSYSQSSVGNRNSSSSLESFDNLQPVKLSPLSGVVLPDNVLVRRDSGSWSSDRNSTSSGNSVENPFMSVMASKRLLLGLNKKGQPLESNSSDHGYDSFSVSSSDSYPSVNGSPVKLEPRLTQIPEDWQPEEEDLDKKLKLVTEDSNGPPDCDKLCAEADLLLAKSHEKEKDGDLVMAALLCDSAAARARAAMEAPYNSSRSLTGAKMKHSTCVLRSANLYRRLKDHEADERRRQKGHHSRQGSRDSTHSRHSRQGSRDSTHSKSKDSAGTEEVAENFGKSIEIYGTLPKKGSRKKNGACANGSLKMRDDQVYQDFLDKQRKNTSLAEELNETKKKNVDPTQLDIDLVDKRVPETKGHRKSHVEGVPPKSPTRKKVDPLPKTPEKEENQGKKKAQKQQHQASEPPSRVPASAKPSNGMEISHRDLLSPITSPDKKQHKIKRKLMGNFMKRKNRSLPDLREDASIGDKIDCFLDDAIIKTPPGKTNIASITRGFQPHRAFVKKDLNQRPIPLKVSPPTVQPALLTNPKTKLVHTLPSIPKKAPDQAVAAKLDSVSVKPSKIPFMSTTLPKCGDPPANLPPLSPPPRSVDTKLTFKPGPLPKSSAIPVLAPQVPLSPLRQTQAGPVEAKPEAEDLPLPESNPFLAEIQEKRKQVLGKAVGREGKPQAELSMLPRLALVAQGAAGAQSWLKELQSKQQKLSCRQDVPANVFQHAPSRYPKEQAKPSVIKAVEIIEEPKVLSPDSNQAWKQPAQEQPCRAVQEHLSPPELNHSKATTSTVRDIASRFEKVLKIPEPPQQTSSTWSTARKSSENPENLDLLAATEPRTSPERTEHSSAANSQLIASANTSLPMKSALKAWTDPNQTVDVTDSKLGTVPNSNVSQLPAKQDLQSFVVDLRPTETPPSPTIRPVQPPDYATALQRLELMRTSNGSDINNASTDRLEFGRTSNSCNVDNTPTDRLELARTSNNSNVGHALTDRLEVARTCNNSEVGHAPTDRLELARTSNGSDMNHAPPDTNAAKADPPKKKKGPKKSVTFSDKVVLVACAEYDEIDFSTNPLFERVYQQHVESGKGEIPILSKAYSPHNVPNEDSGLHAASKPTPCNLCHSKQVVPPSTYCTDCEFYLSRFTPK